MRPCSKSLELLDSVEKVFEKEHGMFKNTYFNESPPSISSVPNALAVINYVAIGEEECAEEFLQNLMKHIDDFKGGYYHPSWEKDHKICVDEKAALSIAHSCLEKPNSRFLNDIETEAEHHNENWGCLYKSCNDVFSTIDNALLVTAYSCFDEVEHYPRLIEGIENKIRFRKDGLICYTDEADDAYAVANAALAVAYMSVGRADDGIELVEKIEDKIGYGYHDGHLFINLADGRGVCVSPEDNLMMAVALMMRSYIENGKTD